MKNFLLVLFVVLLCTSCTKKQPEAPTKPDISKERVRPDGDGPGYNIRPSLQPRR